MSEHNSDTVQDQGVNPSFETMPLLTSTRKSIKGMPKHVIWQVEFKKEELQWNSFQPQTFSTIRNQEGLQWLHFVGVNEEATLSRILAPFDIHPLVIEDILLTKQQPKIETYGSYVFIVAQAVAYKGQKLQTDQIYIIVGDHFVFSFQNKPLGIFSLIRDHVAAAHRPMQPISADFLVYMMLDCIVDDYFVALEKFESKVEAVDQILFNREQDNILQKIHALKHETTKFRRVLLPLTESLKQIVRGDFAVFSENTRLFIRDAYDHSIHLLSSLDSARDMVSSMTDLYLSFQSNSLNLQIRLLTVITIMITPLTLIAGIYGMNFDNMPELHWEYGYFVVLGVMILICASMCWIFYKKRWL